MPSFVSSSTEPDSWPSVLQWVSQFVNFQLNMHELGCQGATGWISYFIPPRPFFKELKKKYLLKQKNIEMPKPKQKQVPLEPAVESKGIHSVKF